MPVQSDEYNAVCVITVRGELTAGQAPALRAELAAHANRPSAVIDLEACRFISSTGLESLIEALRTCEERGGRLMLAGLDENCRKILEMTRLDHRFECHSTVASAMKAL